jgi:hypothetical protein
VRLAIPVLLMLAVVSVAAQPVTVGTQIVDRGGTATITNGAPVTYVNLTDNAPVAGTVNRATVDWSVACTAAFKVVFFHPTFQSHSSFSVSAVRGPFDSIVGRTTVVLNPPVAVLQGDVVGIVQLQPGAACGSVLTQEVPGGRGLNLISAADLSTNGGTLGSNSNFAPDYQIGVFAYGSDPVLTRILPAAGAVQGASAFFRTSLQLLNPTTNLMTGTIVFHKQGQSASAGDPSLAFTLPAFQTLSYPDIITKMGTSGLGSLDILTNGGAVPIATARVFSDAGAAGTSGFSEEGLRPREAADSFTHLALLIPDLTNFRMNVGVRTLDQGATLNITLIGPDGGARNTRNGVVYPANYFNQVPLSDFVGTTTIEPGSWIQIGSTYPSAAFVYSSVIDNRTSDSTYRLGDIR